MSFILLLFSLVGLAQDTVSEKYCFRSQSETELAKQKFAMIQVPSDVVNTDGNCLVLQMGPHRKDLIQRYILSNFPNARLAFSSEDLRHRSCRLKVEKEKSKVSNNLNLGLNQLQAVKSNSDYIEKEVMEIETLKEFELSVDREQIKGTCRFITQDRYEITLEVRTNPQPIVPAALPPGTIVVINSPPPNQETSVLKTQLQLTRGERINIGESIKSLKDKNNSVSINPEVTIETTQQTSSEKVFLGLQ